MIDYQERVIAERDELLGRINRLIAFIDSERFKALPEAEQARLERQATIMGSYADVLIERIQAFEVIAEGMI